jgi:hypothetical protein
MDDSGQQAEPAGRGGIGLSWFWIGTGIGLLLSAAAVITVVEIAYRRRGRGDVGDELHLVEDLTHAMEEGLDVLMEAAETIGGSYHEASSERIRFGLDPSGAGSGAGRHAWYTGDEE